jgi:hypothetical protein
MRWRNPVALERLTYDRAAKAVTYRSGKSDGPTAGTETADPLEFLARVLVHIPDTGHVTTRYYGWYANRPRGMRQKAAPTGADGPPAIVPARPLAPVVGAVVGAAVAGAVVRRARSRGT